MRLIRRYPNRKLYDVQNSRYVSLKSLREMILSGESLESREYHRRKRPNTHHDRPPQTR